jgi:phosphohistidine phosphatase
MADCDDERVKWKARDFNAKHAMKLLLLRHGDAGKAGPNWPDDRLRPLTRPGRRLSRRSGRLARRLELKPTHAFTSPLARARETAEEFLAAWKSPPRLKLLQLLSPGNDPGETLDAVRALGRNPGDNVILLAGHNPDMGGLAERLGIPLHFGKGTLAVLWWNGSREGARLELFIRADLLADDSD